jgi:sulfur carrier protein ThiS
MNMRILSSLLALGTLTSLMLVRVPSVSADGGNGSNIIPPNPGGGGNGSNIIPPNPGGGGGNGSNIIPPDSGSKPPDSRDNLPFVFKISPESLAAINALLAQLLSFNPQALANATSNASLLPDGSNPSLVPYAKKLADLVAKLNNNGKVTAAELNDAIVAYNEYAEALVDSSKNKRDAVAFLNSPNAEKGLDRTNAPGIRGLLRDLAAQAKP